VAAQARPVADDEAEDHAEDRAELPAL